jgi:hypothetical protein
LLPFFICIQEGQDMNDFLKIAATFLIAVFLTVFVIDRSKVQSSCPSDCNCSETTEVVGDRGWRAEAKAINKRIDSLEARLIPGVRPGSVGEGPK